MERNTADTKTQDPREARVRSRYQRVAFVVTYRTHGVPLDAVRVYFDNFWIPLVIG